MAARGLNQVNIIGNLGSEPEVRYNDKGSAMATFRVATSESWKDRNTGEKRENVEWLNIVAYGAQAEIIEKYLHKGDKVFLSGKLQTRDYQKEGVKHYMTQIVIREMIMLGSKGERPQGSSQYDQNQPPPQQSQDRTQHDDFDDDIPF